MHFSFFKRLNRTTLHTLFGFIGVGALLFSFFSIYNPNNLPIYLLLIPSMLFGLMLLLLVKLVIELHFIKKSKVTLMFIPLFGILLSLLASLHQLSLKDVVLSGILLWLVAFYVNRMPKH